MSLRAKAETAVLWNTISRFSNYGLEFVIGIILARLLAPENFGMIASITVVLAFLEVFINSGFSQALIRQEGTNFNLYSTIFWFNLLIGIIVYIVLYLTAPLLSVFLNNVNLSAFIQVLGITLIINSVSLIQRTILTKEINFKKQTIITIVATVIAGSVSIVMAYSGFGVWSLVGKILVFRFVEAMLLWLTNKWKPGFVFDVKGFKKLLPFASNLLASGAIDVLFKNINYIMVSKYFSARVLGLYTRAEMFKNLPSQNLTAIVTSVSYPVLSNLHNDKEKLTNAFIQVYTVTYFVTSICMFTLIGIADSLILTLVGEKWSDAIILLKLLCLIGLFNPINSLLANLLNIVGRSDIYLRLQFISNILLIPALIIGIYFGINILILGNLICTIIMFLLFSFHGSKFVDFGLKNQLLCLSKNFLIGSGLVIVNYGLYYFLDYSLLWVLIIQVLSSLVYLLVISEVFKLKEYLYLKNLAHRYLKK